MMPSDPLTIAKRLTRSMRVARQDSNYNEARDDFFFIPAMNEWGEQNVIEPDNVYGFGNLQAIRKALAASRSVGFPNLISMLSL
jgi:hypothetical protein